jgi:hypothetical protein
MMMLRMSSGMFDGSVVVPIGFSMSLGMSNCALVIIIALDVPVSSLVLRVLSRIY